jgi:hypothetical protein
MPRHATFRRDCALTGLFYLGLAVCGGVGFMVIRPDLFAQDDPARTLANLMEQEGLARIGIALELGVATFQALASIWFAKLFRETDSFAAGALAAFGMANSIALLVSTALLRTALDVAIGPTGAEAQMSHLLILLSSRMWDVANVFFGLWLIPMGWLVWRANLAHRALGWILIVGGIGYVPLPYIGILAPNAGAWVGLLPVAASIGEFWMIGLLLWIGLRPAPRQTPRFAGEGA